MRALSVDLVASGIRAAVYTLVPLRRLGIVVHGIHELIGGVCREAVSKQLRVERLLLDGRGRVGAWWRDHARVVVLLQRDYSGRGEHIVSGLVRVGLCVHVQVDVDHGGVLGEGRGGKTRSIDHVSRSG